MKYICIDDYEEEAFRKLPKEALDYYRSGADHEITLRANVESFRKWKILPRFLRDVSNIDMSLDVLGQRVQCPIGASPSAMHKLAHPDGELATAKGVGKVGSIMTLSTLSTTTIEDVASSSPDLIKWFQLYLFVDRDESIKMIRRAERAGFKALVLTVDAPRFGTRRRDVRNDFKVAANFVANFDQSSAKGLQSLEYIDAAIKWSDITWLKEVTRLPVLIKGILAVEDSLMALEYKADGIVISNHGGRQLDGVPATIDVLLAISRAINGRCPLFIDGGIRSGSDVFKCLALGATMVFVGRPVLWGLACEGAPGVGNVLAVLRDELELTMKLSGCATLRDISPLMVVHEHQPPGNRRVMSMKKGDTIYQFLQACLETLRKDFNELRSVSADQLVYVKEDLIIPHHYTFYDFIVTKARGKSGPLFAFDVHEDVRLVADAAVEKDESHAGKVLLRSWYERNKHIFPASRWEPYDPTKNCDNTN